MEATQIKKKSGVAEAISQMDEAVREQEVIIDQLNDNLRVVSAGPDPEDKPPTAGGNTPNDQQFCDIEDYLYNILSGVNRNTLALTRMTGRLRI